MSIKEAVLRAKNEWDLDQISVIYEGDAKGVYAADSPVWGTVILKVSGNKRELGNEYAMLKSLAGNCSCRVFGYEEEQGALLEQRVIPGTVLRRETNALNRVGSFINVFKAIHREVESENEFDTYLDWLERADMFCRSHNVEKWIADRMQKSYQIGKWMFEKYNDRMLLHGDLHHDNILVNDQGTYLMIDPKGVVGPAIFDLPRFLLNEMDYVSGKVSKEHIEKIGRMICERVRIPFSDMMMLFYMEVMLANVWNVEDGEEPDRKQMMVADELLEESKVLKE